MATCEDGHSILEITVGRKGSTAGAHHPARWSGCNPFAIDSSSLPSGANNVGHALVIPTRNEPAGYQDVWHLHVHVFPRYPGDELYSSMPLPELASRSERTPYAERLRDYLTLSRTQAR